MRTAADMRLARISPAPPAPEVAPTAAEEEGLAGLVEQYAQLGVQSDVRVEFKSERFKNERCTAAEVLVPFSGCNASFPFPSPDPQLFVRAGGVVGQRVHINVDYDNKREFDANQNLHVYYEGLEDEILQRVEVGNVSFQVPSSRFITAGIPANNFGVQAAAQLGALNVKGIYAQQQGDVVRDRVFTVGEVSSQPVARDLRELDFETGRFFFVIDPARLPGYPAIDVLDIDPGGLASDLRPAAVRVYRLRGTTGRPGLDPNLGGLPAVALRNDSPQRVGPYAWELLIEERDYYIDPSGLWFALRSRLSDDDYLAVSYVLADGVTRVGTFPSGARADGVPDTLQLIHEPRRGPEVPTFRYEMRQIYRVGGDLTRASVQVHILVNESERPLSGGETYVGLLGLAVPNDQNLFDSENRLFPRARDPNGGAPLSDRYVVFPHLMPFGDTLRLQPGERADSVYRLPTSLLRSQAPAAVFTLRFQYEQTGAGDRSVLSLGGFQVRDGSERIFVGGRQLVRGRDYDVVYEVGQVTFLHPDSLFTGPTEVRAQFEQRATFDIAPTTIFGMALGYDLGSRGSLNLIGMFQREKSTFNRPPLGFEPQSSFIGGVSGNLLFQPLALTRALDALPIVSTDVPSTLTIAGELATSRPNPNQVGVAYVEEFESEGGAFLPLGERGWQLGSAPTSLAGFGSGASGVTSLADSNAALLTWQNLVPNADGTAPVQLLPTDIDPSLRFTGATPQVETVLYLQLHPDTVGGLPDSLGRPRWIVPAKGGGPRWRSATQALSSTGLDLTRIEFIEVWVYEPLEGAGQRQGAQLALDFGDILEDAVDFSPDTIIARAPNDTVFRGQHRIGVGELDTERRENGVWNAALDDLGILGDQVRGAVDVAGQPVDPFPACEQVIGAVTVVYGWGDPRARCTRRNGALDTEDLDGDNRLDITVGRSEENFLRFVLPLGDDRFFVRNGGTGWKLYRIPTRGDTTTTVGTPTPQRVRSVRLTMLAAPPAPGRPTEAVFVGLARLKLVGARWLKRAPTPIKSIYGATGEAHGEVTASVVSTENSDLGYVSPPGVVEQGESQGTAFQVGQTQINERSLRLLAKGLGEGERAEAFLRFTEAGNRGFLTYRQLKVWARGRGPGWEDGDLEFFIKAGKDENNFYMYRTPIRTSSWEPEVVIQFDRWLALRAVVERAWLRGEPPSGAAQCGGDSLAYVACDGPYLVHVRDPGIGPPNLAAVQELATGILRVGEQTFIEEAELWVDDIRLSQVVDDPGYAAALDVRLTGADVFDAAFSFSHRDDRFRQLGEDPSYLTDNVANLIFNVRLDRLLPRGLGLSLPFSVAHSRSGVNPFFLAGTDVRADAVQGLRETSARSTQYRWSLRRASRSPSTFGRMLIDPVTLGGTMTSGRASSSLSASETRSTTLSADYANAPGEQTVRGIPGFVDRLLGGLPGFLRNTAWVTAARNSRLRWNPVQVRLSSGYAKTTASRQSFRRPVVDALGDVATVVRSANEPWRNEISLALQPYRTLSFNGSLASTRDLRDYGDSTTTGILTGLEGRTFLGLDVGFESQRRSLTNLSLNPPLTSWLRPRFLSTSSFSLTRDPNRTPARLEGDTAGAFALAAAFSNSRRQEFGVTVDWRQLGQRAFGETSIAGRVLAALVPVDLRAVRDRQSVYDRAGFTPPLSYQLALGGIDAFRSVGGIVAASASENRTRTVTGGLSLPLGLRATVLYEDQERLSFTRSAAGQTELRSSRREWPSGSLTWSWAPTVPLIRDALVFVNAQVQYRERETGSEVPFASGGRSGVHTDERAVTPVLTLTWLKGVLTSFQFSDSRVFDLTNGNLGRTDQNTWNASVNFSWRPPSSIVRLPNDLRTQLRLSGSDVSRCLQTAESTECTSVSFTGRREWGVQADTDVPPNLTAGLSASYLVSEERHFDRKFSQLTFTAFIQLSFISGEIR